MKKIILVLLGLSACCNTDPNDCTANELAAIKEQREKETTPQLVTEKDGIRVWRIWTREPSAYDHWTYFTTPCGDVSANIQWKSGKATHNMPSNINGTGCQ